MDNCLRYDAVKVGNFKENIMCPIRMQAFLHYFRAIFFNYRLTRKPVRPEQFLASKARPDMLCGPAGDADSTLPPSDRSSGVLESRRPRPSGSCPTSFARSLARWNGSRPFLSGGRKMWNGCSAPFGQRARNNRHRSCRPRLNGPDLASRSAISACLFGLACPGVID